MKAACKDRTEVVKVLIAHGADVSCKNNVSLS